MGLIPYVSRLRISRTNTPTLQKIDESSITLHTINRFQTQAHRLVDRSNFPESNFRGHSHEKELAKSSGSVYHLLRGYVSAIWGKQNDHLLVQSETGANNPRSNLCLLQVNQSFINLTAHPHSGNMAIFLHNKTNDD